MLYDIHQGRWSDDICTLLDIQQQMLPEVKDCAADFGMTDTAVLGVPSLILGVAGDQQAATVGQACSQPGMVKSTYGTGCFAVLNTGTSTVQSGHRLRDGLGVIADAAETGALAEASDREQNVI